ncbi:MAG TPA: glycine oxidase ThiO [Longimicrobiales bacterium]
MKRNEADVAIIGAGVIGCSIAREAAARGLRVIVAERDSPGRRATWAAAGMLSPLGEVARSGPFLELADESLQRFAAYAYALREDSGIDIEYRTSGKLQVSLGDADDELHAVVESPLAARFDVSELDGAAARELEPALSAHVTRALRIGRDHRVNNRLLAQALIASATAAGVIFRTANPATALITRGGRAAGVRLASGEHIEADRVVLAAGAWTGQLEELPRVIPVRPIKGQMFAVDGRVRGTQRPESLLQHVILSRQCYVIPRDDGRLLVGATVEDVGFRKGPTPRGLSQLMSAARSVLPIIDDLPLVETWAGFRPAAPDHLPILGADPDVAGLFYATGHFRNGILLAPITAVCIAELLAGGSSPVPLDPFSIARFGGS